MSYFGYLFGQKSCRRGSGSGFGVPKGCPKRECKKGSPPRSAKCVRKGGGSYRDLPGGRAEDGRARDARAAIVPD